MKQILNDDQIVIEDQDGFDYTVHVSEVIKSASDSQERQLSEQALPSDTEIFNKDVDRKNWRRLRKI